MCKQQLKMVSFDIYDTLITRNFYRPIGIFFLMQKIIENDTRFDILPDIIKREFAYIRIEAEKKARQENNSEITIYEIYREIKNSYCLSQEAVKALVELEIELEINNNYIIEENLNKLIHYMEEGVKIVLISDMYLPKEFFFRLFEKICPILNKFSLYVSCELGLTKASGQLFEYVKKAEKIEYAEWLHIGDNVISDDSIPELLGIKTVHIDLNENKECLYRFQNLKIDDILTSEILCGLSKNISNNIDYRIGFSYAGIVLYSYVRWVVEMSQIQGIQSLYFIARDGYVLKQIADIIIEKNNISIKTYYLYGSRKAWRVLSGKEYDLLKEYLYQEINSDERYALVDTQGTGLSIDYLSNVMRTKIKVFYYTLLESSIGKKIVAYSYSSYAGKGIIEALCRAPHGSTLGYVKEKGKIKPKLSNVSNVAFYESRLEEYIKGVRDFTQFVENYRLTNKVEIELFSTSEKLLRYCEENADKELADYIGDIPHNSENNEEGVYAPKLSKEDIFNIENKRTTQSLSSYYSGDNLHLSYKRLNNEEKQYLEWCKELYLKKDEVEETKFQHKIVIYGYGIYGKELYHRLFKAQNIKIVSIVDANYHKYKNDRIKVDKISVLKKAEYDYVVISLYDEYIAHNIKDMLVLSGITRDKIYFRKEFITEVLQMEE